MNFAIILESFKFYKVKHERTIQAWFIFLYAANILIYILPAGYNDFNAYVDALMAALRDLNSSSLAAWSAPAITPGALLFIGLVLLVNLINAFFSWLYAALYIAEKDGRKPFKVFLACLSALPRMFLILAPILVAVPLTFFLGFIPVLVICMILYFLPVKLALGKIKLADAARQSFEETMGKKLFIFLEVMILSILLSIPGRIISSLAANVMPAIIISSFFIVLQSFAQGRMMGILYQIIVKKEPLVITPKTKGQA